MLFEIWYIFILSNKEKVNRDLFRIRKIFILFFSRCHSTHDFYNEHETILGKKKSNKLY